MQKTKEKLEKNNFIVKLITNLWFTQISKNSNFNYSNLKTNGTNSKFIIFQTQKQKKLKINLNKINKNRNNKYFVASRKK